MLTVPSDGRVAENIVSSATIAFAFLKSNPKYRPTMKCVSQAFLFQKRPLLDRLQAVSLFQLKNRDLYKYGKCETPSRN
ncbi:hypothetical protein GQ457_16G030000 [Hibiscus cannabinus]